MTRLSVNVNKVATLRNARGGNKPNVVQVAKDCEAFGAQGITVHPRPDQRHITRQDVLDLKECVSTEFNIEGYPDKRYMDLVKQVMPSQATLVPDPPDALTSNAGWDTIGKKEFLKEVVGELNQLGIRTSIFIEPVADKIEAAADVGTKRIELYTEPYAFHYSDDRDHAIADYVHAANIAHDCGLGINAGHDLSLENLRFLTRKIPIIDEVSIGHALICDALYFGLENTIQLYLRELE